MEIKRLKNNQIQCALTEKEIEEMGFCIDDIIGNTETTQQFMRVVLEKVEEQEQIDIDLLSPMVRAELLQDHSMSITFGGITEEEKREMMDKMMELMEHLAEKLPENLEQKGEKELQLEDGLKEKDVIFKKATVFAIEVRSLEMAAMLSKYFSEREKLPKSALYKMDGKYYLILDFIHFSKKELRPFAFAVLEYNNRYIAADAKIAYIKEHGNCIIKRDAVRDLMQL